MKNTILKFLISRGGAIATPVAAAIVAAVAVKVDPLSHELAEQIKGPEVIGWLTAFLIALVSAWANGKQREGAKEIQLTLMEAGKDDVRVDGVIGPVTISNIHAMAGVQEKVSKKKSKLRLRWPWGRQDGRD